MTLRVLALHDPERELLIASAGMLHYDLVLHAWLRMGGCSRVIAPALHQRGRCSFDDRYARLLHHPRTEWTGLPESVSGTAVARQKDGMQLRDRLVMEQADVIETGCIAPDGRMSALIRRLRRKGLKINVNRLTSTERSAPSVFRQRWDNLKMDLPEYQDYLWHFTRMRAEPWLEDGMADYLDDLLGFGEQAPYSAFTVIKRIVSNRRILAGSRLIRGGHRVVCFSAASWSVIRTLFTWQAHLHRARFEPFAVGIRKTSAGQLGIRPVRYGPVSEYLRLPALDRWLFQKHDAGTSDWIAEAEWRHPGDLDLKNVSDEDLAVLTPEGFTKLTDWQ